MADLREARRLKGAATRAKNIAVDTYKRAIWEYEDTCKNWESDLKLCDAALDALDRGAIKAARAALEQLQASAKRKETLKVDMETKGELSGKAVRAATDASVKALKAWEDLQAKG
jgi:hypothetical protein